MVLILIILFSVQILLAKENPSKLSLNFKASSVFYSENLESLDLGSTRLYLKDTPQSYSSILSLQSAALLSLFIILLASSVALGFYIGTRKHKSFAIEIAPQSPLSIESTVVSSMTSPNFLLESPDSLPFVTLFSHKSFDELIYNGSYAKNFIEEKLLWKSDYETVYLSEHKLDKQSYLVKIIPISIDLHEDLKDQKLFKEINKIKRLDCRHVARYVTCWIEENEPTQLYAVNLNVLLYVQMEYIKGIPLDQWANEYFERDTALRVIKQTCKVLNYLHHRGIQHGEITMQNIFLDKYGKAIIGDYDFNRCMCADKKGLIDIIKQLLSKIDDKEKAMREILEFDFINFSGLDKTLGLLG